MYYHSSSGCQMFDTEPETH